MQGKKKQEADLRSIKIFPLAWSIIPDRVTRQIQSQSSRYMPSLVLSLSIICYLVNCSLPFVVFTLWRSKGLGGFVKGQKKCRRLEIKHELKKYKVNQIYQTSLCQVIFIDRISKCIFYLQL